jgi:hypothetical protein
MRPECKRILCCTCAQELTSCQDTQFSNCFPFLLSASTLLCDLQMLIQTTATWLHYFCAFLGACTLAEQSIDPSTLVEMVCTGRPRQYCKAPHVAAAHKALSRALITAVSPDSSAADFQAATAAAVPVLQPLITNSADHAELMLLIGRLLSIVSDNSDGELRMSLSWLEAHSQSLHRQVSEELAPLQQRLVDLKAAVMQTYGISAAESRHWDKPFFEV